MAQLTERFRTITRKQSKPTSPRTKKSSDSSLDFDSDSISRHSREIETSCEEQHEINLLTADETVSAFKDYIAFEKSDAKEKDDDLSTSEEIKNKGNILLTLKQKMRPTLLVIDQDRKSVV